MIIVKRNFLSNNGVFYAILENNKLFLEITINWVEWTLGDRNISWEITILGISSLKQYGTRWFSAKSNLRSKTSSYDTLILNNLKIANCSVHIRWKNILKISLKNLFDYTNLRKVFAERNYSADLFYN